MLSVIGLLLLVLNRPPPLPAAMTLISFVHFGFRLWKSRTAPNSMQEVCRTGLAVACAHRIAGMQHEACLLLAPSLMVPCFHLVIISSSEHYADVKNIAWPRLVRAATFALAVATCLALVLHVLAHNNNENNNVNTVQEAVNALDIMRWVAILDLMMASAAVHEGFIMVCALLMLLWSYQAMGDNTTVTLASGSGDALLFWGFFPALLLLNQTAVPQSDGGIPRLNINNNRHTTASMMLVVVGKAAEDDAAASSAAVLTTTSSSKKEKEDKRKGKRSLWAVYAIAAGTGLGLCALEDATMEDILLFTHFALEWLRVLSAAAERRVGPAVGASSSPNTAVRSAPTTTKNTTTIITIPSRR